MTDCDQDMYKLLFSQGAFGHVFITTIESAEAGLASIFWKEPNIKYFKLWKHITSVTLLNSRAVQAAINMHSAVLQLKCIYRPGGRTELSILSLDGRATGLRPC